MKPQSTSKPVALVVIALLGVFAILSGVATWDLIRVLILRSAQGKAIDPASVGFIATMSGLCGTSLGLIGGSLINTERQQTGTSIGNAENVQAGGPTNVTEKE